MQAFQPQAWAQQTLARVPGAWRERVRRMHAKRREPAPGVSPVLAGQAADAWLEGIAQRFGRLRVTVDMTDAELCDLAAQRAREAFSLAEYVPGRLLDAPALRARLSAFVARYGIKAPGERVQDGPALARMTDSLWWRRGLRKAQARELEAGAIGLGYVSSAGEIYASNATVKRRAEQRARNARSLEDTQAVNLDTGEVYNLARLAAASVANPRIRRGELMTRISGFEAVARGLGHDGVFLTITTPGAYHPKRKNRAGKVFDNRNWNGQTPRQAQQYLTRTWANARAALFRAGVRCYGFRIAEPHHDGTPHWHLLLFVAPAERAALLSILAAYARRAHPEEMTSPEAKKARFDAKRIDWTRGTAAGYVAKYVSKNIDGCGYQVQGDFEGEHDQITPSHRVEAWASTWGIRQFQQVGGPPVGVWRELRRLAESGDYSERVQAARLAADCGRNGKDENGTAGNWRRFVEVMGGPVVERAALPLRVAYSAAGERFHYAAGEMVAAPLNRYGELSAPAAYGVRDVVRGEVFAGVRYQWEIKRGGDAGTNEGLFIRAGVGCDGDGMGRADSGAGAIRRVRTGENSPAWTRVNNCSAELLAGQELESWKQQNAPAWDAIGPDLRRKIEGGGVEF